MFFGIYLLNLCILSISSLVVDDLETLFGNKHCIKASLASMTLSQDESVMIDSSTDTLNDIVLFNSSKTDKSILTKVHELAQFNEIEVLYKLISEEGPPHAKIYSVFLVLGDEEYKAVGSSLKKAKQSAASLALENTLYDHPPEKIKAEEEKLPQTPTVVLNNIATKVGIGVTYFLLNENEEKSIDSYGTSDEAYSKSKSPNIKINSTYSPLRVPVEDSHITGPFFVKVKVGDFTFKGSGHTIQAARHDAALKALQDMEKQVLFKDNACLKDDSVAECREKKESFKSPITRIHEAGQRHNIPVEFNVIGESGKAHQKTFITECKLGHYVTEATGNSKKESKRLAAEKMLVHLSELQTDYNEKDIVNGLTNKKKKKKRKKNKIVRDDVKSIVHTVSEMASAFLSGGSIDDSSPSQSHGSKSGKSNFKSEGGSPKDKILEIGAKLNIALEFTDLNKRGDLFYSLLTLQVEPPHLCLGKGLTRDMSHEKVATYGIKFLHKSGIFEKVDVTQYQDILDDEGYDLEELKEDSMYKSLEDSKNL